MLNGYPDIELTMLQGLSYCFYEVLDNVLTHSEKICGTVLMRYLPEDNKVQILVADDGIGLQKRMNWIICGKGEMAMITFRFKEIGENLGTRQLGAKVREQLLPLIHTNDKVVLDFEGVNVVSNSFADECLAKLLFSMSFEELKQRTTFTSVNDFARKNIAIAFRRRIAVISNVCKETI